jgi:two-component system, LuxR family, response regulator FixJ
MVEPAQIALVEDDAAVLDSLQLYLDCQDLKTSCFTAAETLLAAVDGGVQFNCIVSDVCMPGMSGLDLVHHLKARSVVAPIILITGHGDIDMAVCAIKSGAFNFIEKPFDEARLLASIRDALETARQKAIDEAQTNELYSRVKALSERQRQVMDLAVAGLSNKEIGSQLNISPKTVENHRAWVMERTGAKNLADLVRIAMQIQARSQRVA